MRHRVFAATGAMPIYRSDRHRRAGFYARSERPKSWNLAGGKGPCQEPVRSRSRGRVRERLYRYQKVTIEMCWPEFRRYVTIASRIVNLFFGISWLGTSDIDFAVHRMYGKNHKRE